MVATRNVLREEKIRGSLRRLENIAATKPFQDALQNLIDDHDELSKAEADPVGYFEGFGVVVPKGFGIQITRRQRAESEQKQPASRALRFHVRICISWCTEDACYVYCIEFDL